MLPTYALCFTRNARLRDLTHERHLRFMRVESFRWARRDRCWRFIGLVPRTGLERNRLHRRRPCGCRGATVLSVTRYRCVLDRSRLRARRRSHDPSVPPRVCAWSRRGVHGFTAVRFRIDVSRERNVGCGVPDRWSAWRARRGLPNRFHGPWMSFARSRRRKRDGDLRLAPHQFLQRMRRPRLHRVWWFVGRLR
jgi:hypothetical protein